MEPILDALSVERVDGRVCMDLTAVRFIRPVHMVAAVARAHAARLDGDGFHLNGPSSRDPSVYAARMRVGSSITDLGGTHDLPTSIREHDQARSLLEISQIGSRNEVRRLARLVHEKVTAIDAELANALHESLGEIGLNVQDHADSVGFVAAQTMPGLRELRFAVADAGLGFLSTLRRRGAASHQAAIEMALDGVSRFDDPDRGTGVQETARLVTELGGRVYLASGNAEVIESATSREYQDSGNDFPGTLFEASIPLSSGKHARRLS